MHEALNAIIALSDAPIHDSDGPLWYRGNVGCSRLTEDESLDKSLAAIGASRVVIGHTPTPGRQVLERFGGKVIEIDTGMLSAAYQGSGFALIIDGDGVVVAQEKDAAITRPVPHPRRVGDRVDSLDAAALSDLLSSGEIAGTATDDAGRTIVDVSDGEISVRAVFTRSPRKSGLEPELAAYRLDRLLSADLVPVTVSREVDGRRGTLQFLPARARDEVYRSRSGQGSGAWCPLQRQWASLYVFDVLIHNEGRSPASMVYNTGNWQLMSMGHNDAFGRRVARPAYLREQPIELTTGWIEALHALTDERLNETLGDVLPRRELAAVGKRRDMLLEEAGR